MASPAIDYDALAQQHGASIDYDSLAQQHGAVDTAAPKGAQGLTWITDPDGNSMQVPFSTAAKILNKGNEYEGDEFFRSGQYRSGADTQGQKRGFMNSLSDAVGGMTGLGSQEQYNEKIQEANNPTVKGQVKQVVRGITGADQIGGIVKGAEQSGRNTLQSLGNVRDSVSRARAALAKGDTDTAEAQLEDANGHLSMAAGHALATVTAPAGGGVAEQVGTQIGNKDFGGAIGTAVPIVAPLLLHAAGEAAAPSAGRMVRSTGRAMVRNAEPVGGMIGNRIAGAGTGALIGGKLGGTVGAEAGAATGAMVGPTVGQATTSVMRSLGNRLSQSDIGWNQTPTKFAEPIGPQPEAVERNAADLEPSSDNPQVEGLRPAPSSTVPEVTSTEDTEGVTNPQAEQAANLSHPHNMMAANELRIIGDQRMSAGTPQMKGHAMGYYRAADTIDKLGDKSFTEMSDDDISNMHGVGEKTLPILQAIKKTITGQSDFEKLADAPEEKPAPVISPEEQQAIMDSIAKLKTGAHLKLDLPQGSGFPERQAPAINEQAQADVTPAQKAQALSDNARRSIKAAGMEDLNEKSGVSAEDSGGLHYFNAPDTGTTFTRSATDLQTPEDVLNIVKEKQLLDKTGSMKQSAPTVGSSTEPLNFMGADVYKMKGRWFSRQNPSTPFKPVIDPRITSTLEQAAQQGKL